MRKALVIIECIILAGYGYLASSLGSRKIQKERNDARHSVTDTQYESAEESIE